MPIEVGDGNRSENSPDWTPRKKSRDPSIKRKDWTTRQKTRSEIGDWRDRKMSDHFYFNQNVNDEMDSDLNPELWKRIWTRTRICEKRIWTRTWNYEKGLGLEPGLGWKNLLTRGDIIGCGKNKPTCLEPLQAPVRGLASEKGLRGSGRGGEFIHRDTGSTVKRLRDD